MDFTTFIQTPFFLIVASLIVGFILGKVIKKRKPKINLENQIESIQSVHTNLKEANKEIGNVYKFLKGIEKEL